MDRGWSVTERQFRQYLLSSGRAPNTANTYVANLKGYWTACGQWEITPYEADRSILRGWVADRLASVSSARVHNDLAAIKLFYAWLLDIRYRDDDPSLGLHVKRAKSLPTEPLSELEIRRLMGACDCERDRLLILVMASTGVRLSELAGISAEDVNWQAGTIKVRGKGDKQREIKPAASVLSRLMAYAGMFATGPLWLSEQRHLPLTGHQIRKILYDIAAKAKLDGVHPHRLRSSFATSYLDQHADIQALQEVMGHNSIETTQRYTQSTKQKRAFEQTANLDLARNLVGL